MQSTDTQGVLTGMVDEMIEGEDFYFDESGKMVFLGQFLAKRGHCCESGCLHCPWDYKKRVDPNVPPEFQDPWGRLDNPESCSYGCSDKSE